MFKLGFFNVPDANCSRAIARQIGLSILCESGGRDIIGVFWYMGYGALQLAIRFAEEKLFNQRLFAFWGDFCGGACKQAGFFAGCRQLLSAGLQKQIIRAAGCRTGLLNE